MKTDVYCSFCRLPRKVYSKNHIGVMEIMAFSTVAVIASYGIWRDFHWAGALFFIILAVPAEILHRVRWRQSIICRSCGFDPHLYKSNPDAAAETVKAFMEARRDNPAFLLRSRPQIEPIFKKKEDPLLASQRRSIAKDTFTRSLAPTAKEKGFDAPN